MGFVWEIADSSIICSHFHAYQVQFDNDWSFFLPGQEINFSSLDSYTMDDRLLVNISMSIVKLFYIDGFDE